MQVAPTTTVVNTGTMEATAGSTLTLLGGTFNNTGGLIQAVGTGSLVNLNSVTISGGTLTGSGGGVFQNITSLTLDGTVNVPTISTGTTVKLLDATNTY